MIVVRFEFEMKSIALFLSMFLMVALDYGIYISKFKQVLYCRAHLYLSYGPASRVINKHLKPSLLFILKFHSSKALTRVNCYVPIV
jgi:hypothetical protein